MKPGIIKIACIGLGEETFLAMQSFADEAIQVTAFDTAAGYCLASNNHNFNVIVTEGNTNDPLCLQIKKEVDRHSIITTPFTVISNKLNVENIKAARQNGIAEIFLMPLGENIPGKLQILASTQKGKNQVKEAAYEYKVPFSKRLFDIVISSMALLALSPVFLLAALAIRLESKGKVLYYSLRVGTGYKIFKFYKFRSMFTNADQKLSQLKHLNQYAKPGDEKAIPTNLQCEECQRLNKSCTMPMYADNKVWCEKTYAINQLAADGGAFVKIKDDPRITRIGKFIRNSSIDELPQLWNVLKGDMSIVGNRPLPLYEAEKLTTDDYALRFMAPAGITGLWQVSKRGKGEMSEKERIGLDNDYAKSFGLMFDIKLILKTIPALFQKENV